MFRYALTIEYDGSSFCGWQRQENGLSVQGAIESALIGYQQTPVIVHGAGRTDAGVHALAQVAHIDFDRAHDPFRVQEALNFHLRPHPISIIACKAVDAGFEARFSAVMRHYLFRILSRRPPPALNSKRVWWVTRNLDVAAMANAALAFEGHHDFTTFRSSQCQAASPVKSLSRFRVEQVGDDIHCRVAARSFLHNQVRSMVGSLKLVGEGRWRQQDVARALAARDRSACGPVAPPEGLYLERVDYEPDLPLPAMRMR